MIEMLAVGLAGATGAVTRYLVDGAVRDRTTGVLPWGTMTVNVLGSFILGIVTGAVLFHGASGMIRSVVGVGFCGGLTTWSTASWETTQLFEIGRPAEGLMNAVGGLAASLAAAGAGLLIAFVS